MARRKTVSSEVPSPGVEYTCGECSRAYGYCLKGADGRPIACRCDVDFVFLKFCGEKACNLFSRRSDPVPEDFPVGYSKNRHQAEIREKVVPLFREGEDVPWMYVRSRDIPPQGISWDGTPLI